MLKVANKEGGGRGGGAAAAAAILFGENEEEVGYCGVGERETMTDVCRQGEILAVGAAEEQQASEGQYQVLSCR